MAILSVYVRFFFGPNYREGKRESERAMLISKRDHIPCLILILKWQDTGAVLVAFECVLAFKVLSFIVFHPMDCSYFSWSVAGEKKKISRSSHWSEELHDVKGLIMFILHVLWKKKKQAPQLVGEERSLELKKQLTQCLNSEGSEPFGDERDFLIWFSRRHATMKMSFSCYVGK